MIRELKLVCSFDFAELVDRFEGLLDAPLEVERATYGTTGCAMVYVRNPEMGIEMRVIFDPSGAFRHRQGIHTTTEIDEYELADKFERGHDDGFDTIWVHP